ncbi:MAG: hypothetical protein ABR964_06910 [Tepidisphaeraceae bacterium]|jgi:hypothetical protein
MAEQSEVEILRHLFDIELSRRDAINGGLDLPAAVITALFGSGIYFFQRTLAATALGSGYIFWVALFSLFASVALIMTTFVASLRIMRVAWNREYLYPPEPKQLYEYMRNLFAYHKKCGTDPQVVETQIRGEEAKNLADLAQDLADSNQVRGDLLFYARRWLVVAMYCFFLSSMSLCLPSPA